MKKPEIEIKNPWYIDNQLKNQLENISYKKVIFSRWNIFKNIIQNQLKKKKKYSFFRCWSWRWYKLNWNKKYFRRNYVII